VTDNLLTNSLDRFRGTSPVRHDAFLLERVGTCLKASYTFGLIEADLWCLVVG